MRARTFRVFVSSTFADFQEERRTLHESVFPELSARCERVGFSFQAVDLRWGVSEAAAIDQQTLKICLGEIARCRSTSRPSFIALLGDRYGWCPLPTAIPCRELDLLRSFMSTEERDLLTAWYVRDDNALPSAFQLRPRSGMWLDTERWSREAEEPLRRALKRVNRNRSSASRPP